MAKVNPIQVQKFLGGIDYPCSKQDIINRAKERGADDQVLDTLSSLRMERFNSPNDVSEAIGDLE